MQFSVPSTFSHTATPNSSEEDVGYPDQKKLVITGKTKRQTPTALALETQSNTKSQHAESHTKNR